MSSDEAGVGKYPADEAGVGRRSAAAHATGFAIRGPSESSWRAPTQRRGGEQPRAQRGQAAAGQGSTRPAKRS